MPPIRSIRNRKAPPDGFEDIEDTLLEFSNKMKDAENASHEGKKRHEVLWPIFQISHQREWSFPLDITFEVLPDYDLVQVRATYTSSTTTKRLSRSSCMTGYSRMDMQMAIS